MATSDEPFVVCSMTTRRQVRIRERSLGRRYVKVLSPCRRGGRGRRRWRGRVQAASASAAVFPSGSLRSRSARAAGSQRAWTMAIVSSARFSCRMPPRLRRCRCVRPLEAGTGAVPAWAAKAGALRKRRCPGSRRGARRRRSDRRRGSRAGACNRGFVGAPGSRVRARPRRVRVGRRSSAVLRVGRGQGPERQSGSRSHELAGRCRLTRALPSLLGRRARRRGAARGRDCANGRPRRCVGHGCRRAA